MIRVFRAAGIHDGYQLHRDSELVTKDGVVLEVRARADTQDWEVVDLGGQSLWPGLVDIQVNGGGGVLVNGGATPKLLSTMLSAHSSLGTSAIVPTLITSTASDRQAAADAFRSLLEAEGARRLPALHFEGPFISEAKRGIHPREHLARLTPADLAWLKDTARVFPTVLTLAPETLSEGTIEGLVSAGVVVSLGHSNCTFEQGRKAFEEGASLSTHLFNGMSGITARDAGLVGASLEHARYCGLIYDRHHVSRASARIAAQYLGSRLVLVSDCLSPPGGGPQSFEFAGRRLHVSNGVCVADDGTLGGGAVGLLDCLRAAVEDGVMDLEAAVAASTRLPADAVGATSLGRLSPGCPADGIVVDELLNLVGAVRAGVMIDAIPRTS